MAPRWGPMRSRQGRGDFHRRVSDGLFITITTGIRFSIDWRSFRIGVRGITPPCKNVALEHIGYNNVMFTKRLIGGLAHLYCSFLYCFQDSFSFGTPDAYTLHKPDGNCWSEVDRRSGETHRAVYRLSNGYSVRGRRRWLNDDGTEKELNQKHKR